MARNQWTRRSFLQQTIRAAAGVGVGWKVARADTTASRLARPNFLIILADDMGFSDLGCYGSEIHTPNLDRLAAEGIRFTQAYSAARCCPSRAALLTGLNPHQAGMGDMVSRVGQHKPPGPYQGYLNDRCVTLAEVLRPAGYRTYMSGKWHVGEAPEHWPRRRGFDRYYGLISGASSYFEILDEGPNTRVMALDDEPIRPEGDHFYMTDAFTDYAVRYIREHDPAQGPFLLYLAYTAPHWPLHALPEDIAKYRGKYREGWDHLREQRYARMREMGIIRPEWALSPRDPEVPAWDQVADQDDMDLRMAVYAAMIDRMDQGIGRVLDALRERGVAENTLVLFLSDNGGCHESIMDRKLHKPGTRAGDRGSYLAYERGWANASNTPFRWFKHWVHEGGIAMPLIAWWPAGIRQRGALTDQVAHITDVLPTCLELAGATYPDTVNGRPVTPLFGRSLVPVLAGQARDPHPRLYWEHEGNRAIREGKWKLVATDSGPWELYDMEADRTELRNLADQYPDRAAALLAAWRQWADATGVKYRKGAS
ncbi:MAG TPA: arylsulfatase [Candidatus Hydrogenedentes bacterium]|nr:arylsulfatase [Candidatus Hydrogenedentota bacterium]